MSSSRPSSITAMPTSTSAQSRFLEGSMNDRTSNVPPPEFMGQSPSLAQQQSFERQFGYNPVSGQSVSLPQIQSSASSSSGPPGRPRVTSGNRNSVQSTASDASVASKRSFFARLGDGVRERLSFVGRSRSTSTVGSWKAGGATESREAQRREEVQHEVPAQAQQLELHTVHIGNSQNDSEGDVKMEQAPPLDPSEQQQQQQQQPTSMPPSLPAAFATSSSSGSGARPSPDEIMASYKQLQQSGFFSAHAIQSTRHVPPPSAANLPPLPPPPQQAAPAPPLLFSKPLPDLPAFEPLPTIPSTGAQVGSPTIAQGLQQQQQHQEQRGTKRSQADAGVSSASGSGAARKLVKKLRKSTSRFGSDLNTSLRRTGSFKRPGSSASASASVPAPTTAPSAVAAEQTSRPSLSAIQRPPSASQASSGGGGSILTSRRSLSASFRGGRGRDREPVPQFYIPAISANGGQIDSGSIAGGGGGSRGRNKLSKRTSRSRSRSRNRGGPTCGGGSSARSASRSPARAAGGHQGRRSPSPAARALARRPKSADSVVAQAPVQVQSQKENQNHQHQHQPAPGQENVPPPAAALAAAHSFHYPQRVRVGRPEPLAAVVVPDSNRGIPVVPRIPDEFKFSVGLRSRPGSGGGGGGGEGAGFGVSCVGVASDDEDAIGSGDEEVRVAVAVPILRVPSLRR